MLRTLEFWHRLSTYSICVGLLIWIAGKVADARGVDGVTVETLLVAGAYTVIGSLALRVLVWIPVLFSKPASMPRVTAHTEYPSDAQLMRESYSEAELRGPDPDAPYPSDASTDGGKEELTEAERVAKWRISDTGYPSDSHLLSEAYKDAAKHDLELPGKSTRSEFQTPDLGEDFDCGSEHSSANESHSSQHWISFGGSRLQLNTHGSDFHDTESLSFDGEDAKGQRAALAWAKKMQRANGTWFPRKSAFARLCAKMGFDTNTVRQLEQIYERD
jgi:hypothetical protein